MDKIKSDSEKLKGQHLKFRMQMENFSSEMDEVDNKLSEQELKCYMNGDEICMTHFENYLLAYLETKRKIDKQQMLKNRSCWSSIPYSLRPKGEFEWDIKSEEGLKEYQKFFECSRSYYENMIIGIKEQADLKKAILKKLLAFKH